MPFTIGSEVREVLFDGTPNDIDLSNDGKLLAVAIHEGKPSCIRLYSTKDGACLAEFGQGEATGHGVAFVEGGKSLCFLTWGSLGTSKQFPTLWKVKLPKGKPEKLKSLNGEWYCKGLERNPKGTLIATTGVAVRVIDLKQEKIVARVVGVAQTENTSVHLVDDKHMWTATELGSLIRCEIKKKPKQLENLDAPPGFCMQARVSPDGRWLVGVGEDGEGVVLYDLQVGAQIKRSADGKLELANRSRLRGAVAFSHDSRALVFPTGKMQSLSLPDLKTSTATSENGATNRDIAVKAVTAFDAPLVAFAFRDAEKVVLVPTK